MRTRAAALLILALPFAAVAIAPRLVVDPVATAVASRFAHASALVARVSAAEPEPVPAPAPEPAEAESEPDLPARETRALRPLGRAARRDRPASHALFVARSIVERAIRAKRRPSGHPVGASDAHPAGIAVVGGAGPLRAGDVLTEVEGRPVRSVEDVVVAVGGAVRAKAKAVSGRFWRGGEPWTITVEIPW